MALRLAPACLYPSVCNAALVVASLRPMLPSTPPRLLMPLPSVVGSAAAPPGELPTSTIARQAYRVRSDGSIKFFKKEAHLTRNPVEALPPALNTPPAELLNRDSALLLARNLQERLGALQEESERLGRKKEDVAAAAQLIFDDASAELIRQVSAHCIERGQLLAQLWSRSTHVVQTLCDVVDEMKRDRHAKDEETNRALLEAQSNYRKMLDYCDDVIERNHAEWMQREEQHEAAVLELRENGEALRRRVIQLEERLEGHLQRDAALLRTGLAAGALSPRAGSAQEAPDPKPTDPVEDEAASVVATFLRKLKAAEDRAKELQTKLQERDLLLIDSRNEIRRLQEQVHDAAEHEGIAEYAGQVSKSSISSVDAAYDTLHPSPLLPKAALGEKASSRVDLQLTKTAESKSAA